MKNKIATLFILLSFIGCSTREAFDGLQTNDNYEKALMSMQTVVVNDHNQSTVMSVLYLNAINDLYRDKEYFLITSNQPFTFSMRMNKDIALEIKSIESDSLLVQNLPFSPQWSHNTLVSFQHTQARTIKLEFYAQGEQKSVINFAKNLLQR